MKSCECKEPHESKRIVLTGGPGAGKTAILELIRQYFCVHVKVLPESASVIFGGGFPRGESEAAKQAAQRAIFYVQRELESAGQSENPAIILCDRGTVDGAAYWVGSGDLWPSVGTTLDAEIKRYDAVIHLRTPTLSHGYNHQNPLRLESAEEAAAIDLRIAQAWDKHPCRFIVEPSEDFLSKSARTLNILRGQMPECCRRHFVPPLDEPQTK
jgi:predicted ATPase